MNISQLYILISILALAVILLILVLTRKNMQKPLSVLSALAFGFVIAGIIFGEDPLVGYSLMGVGVILAFIDIIKKPKRS